MSRGLSTAFKLRLAETVVRPAMFVEFLFDSGASRLWTGETNISADLGAGFPQTWLGGAFLGSIQTSGESDALQSRKLTFTINNTDANYYAVVANEPYQGRKVNLWFALMQPVSYPAVEFYYLLEEARVDTISITDTETEVTMQINCVSRLVNLFRPNTVIMDEFTHRQQYPGDKFYQYKSQMEGYTFPWQR